MDVPLQCISEIISRLNIFLQTLATCAHMHSVALIISQTIFCGISSTANITKILCLEKISHSYSKLIPLYSNSVHPPLMTHVCLCVGVQFGETISQTSCHSLLLSLVVCLCSMSNCPFFFLVQRELANQTFDVIKFFAEALEAEGKLQFQLCSTRL